MLKLYEKNSYMRECTATVQDSFENNGKYYITLDQSIFFPEEGGQYADTGVLVVNEPESLVNITQNNSDISQTAVSTIRLLDGQIIKDDSDENGLSKGAVIYEVSQMLTPGTAVICQLDWNSRYDRMQNHSGEHVITGTIHNKYGFNNVGFHLSDDGFVTLDIDGVLSYDQVIEMEREANKYIYANFPITDSYPARDELSAIDYRSKIEIDGQVRLITIGNERETIDVCACCAPHVKSTGEIGIIKVISVIKWKKGVQIAILCGRRALEYIEHEHVMLSNISRNLSTSPENVWNVVKSHMDEIVQLKTKLAQTVEKGLLAAVLEIAEDDPHVIITDTELSAANMKNVYNALCDRFSEGYVGVFTGDDSSGYRYNAGIVGKDARDLAAVMREKLGAKGGGSPEMIQGRVEAAASDIIQLFAP